MNLTNLQPTPAPHLSSEEVVAPSSQKTQVTKLPSIILRPKAKHLPGLSDERQREISELKSSSEWKKFIEKGTNKAESVEQFFGRWNLKGTEFSKEDVEELYRMMKEHPLSHTPFYALFGLKFSSLLEEFSSLKNTFPPEMVSHYGKQWCFVYKKCYAELLAILANDFDSDFAFFGKLNIKVNCMVIEHLSGEMQKTLKIELSKKKSLERYIQQPHQLNYDKRISSFMIQWDKTCQLFIKFLSSPEAVDLLLNAKLERCSGVSEAMPLSTLLDMQKAGKNFYKYVAFLRQCIDESKIPIPNEIKLMFEDVLTRMKPTMFDEPCTSPQEITALCKNLYHTIFCYIENINELTSLYYTMGKENSEFHRILSHFFCCNAWMKDFLAVLDKTFLPVINPLHQIQQLHEHRALLNMQLICNFDDATTSINPRRKFSTHFRINYKQYPAKLRSIYREFIVKRDNLCTFSSIQQKGEELKKSSDKNKLLRREYSMRDIIKAMQDLIKRDIRPCYAMRESLEQLSREIKEITYHTLYELSNYKDESPDELRGLPLLDLTEDLARMLVLKYDLDMTLEGKSEWSCEFPPEYLQFLDLEHASETSSTSSWSDGDNSVTLHENSNLEDQEEMFPNLEAYENQSKSIEPDSASLKTMQPALDLDALISKPPVKKLEETDAPVLSIVTVPRSRQIIPTKKSAALPHVSVDARDLGLKKGMKPLQAVRVLTKLKLTPIEGKKHTKLMDPQGHLVTVIKRHETLDAGLIHAIKEQIAQHFGLKKN